jgi:hypothetical protein
LKGWQHSAHSPVSEQRACITVPPNGLLCIAYKLVYFRPFLRETYCYLVVIAPTKQLNFKVKFLFFSTAEKVLGLQTKVVVDGEFKVIEGGPE